MKTTKISMILFLAFFMQGIGLFAQTDLSEGWEIKTMEELQPPKKIMEAIGVKQGMVIGEIGAGRGRFTVYLAREVGNSGKIYANDIDTKRISYLEERSERLGFTNIETIIGEEDDPLFPEKSLDMAIMVWVYHMIDNPDELLKNLKHSLKPGASFVIIDPVDSEIDQEFNIDRSNPDNKIPTIKERVEKSAKECNYEIVRIETFLPKDYIFVLREKSK